MPTPGGLWVGLGELGCHPQVTDGWTFRLRERKRHVGRSAWHVRVPLKQSPSREDRRTEGKIRTARRAQTVTHWPLLTQIESNMSLKLPRTWDFNLKAEAAKIGQRRCSSRGYPHSEEADTGVCFCGCHEQCLCGGCFC